MSQYWRLSRNPPITLKTRYYLDHFEEMLDFVISGYDHVLDGPHRKFAEEFRSLSQDARCLYVRLTNRKGTVFSRKQLRYDEINDISLAANELETHRFIRPVEEDDYLDLLGLLTRPDLIALIRSHELPGGVALPLASARKGDLVRFATQHIPFSAVSTDTNVDKFLAQARTDELGYLLFLYFGKLRSGLTEFALRDLGVMKTHRFKQEFKPRFTSRETALAAYLFRQRIAQLSDPVSADIDQFYEEAPGWPIIDDPDTEVLRGRAIHRLGSTLERIDDSARALAIHQLSDQFPSTERTVRLLMKQGDRDEAASLLTRMIDNPSCDHELLFAEDFYERKFEKKRVGRLTSLLRESPLVRLDESGRDYPEAAAILHLQGQGADAYHTENVIWGQLFGLVFWDLLFTGEDAAIHTGFDRSPQGLSSGSFFRKNKEAIQQRLAQLSDREATTQELRDIWRINEGAPNHFVHWSPELLDLTCRLVELAPEGALSQILLDLVANWQAHRNGFPDLMVIQDNAIRFIEIKAEGDQLRRNQLAQLERLRRAGFEVEVLKIQWIVDPEQDYVVVDIETTGGNSHWNRITEIGAVKVRDNQVIDEWSSLINPLRRIPGMITQLTGITDEMVADAPTFDTIADEFREFVKGAVFVAHRAKFDYGFIRTEYERLDQDFRCPTLCTVVEMRRHFPGLASYGLANLCREFDINLEGHHRALCDAQATTHLLQKINEKRLANAEPSDPA